FECVMSCFFFSSRRRHTRSKRDWSSDVCSSDLRLITADNDRVISTVAFICGDGGKFWRQALINGVDAFITGDVYYHVGHDMISRSEERRVGKEGSDLMGRAEYRGRRI